MIYFIKEDGTNYVKIGYAEDIKLRLRKMISDNPRRLILIRSLEGDKVIEKKLQYHFGDKRVKGEWFEFCDEMMTINHNEIEDVNINSRQSLLKYKSIINQINKRLDYLINNRYYFISINDFNDLFRKEKVKTYLSDSAKSKINNYNESNFGTITDKRFNTALSIIRSLNGSKNIHIASRKLGLSFTACYYYQEIIRSFRNNYERIIQTECKDNQTKLEL